MLFKNIMVLDENLMAQEKMFVGTKGEKIEFIGSGQPTENFGEVYDGTGKLLMPGFFNAHAHSPMTLMRGYGENLFLQNWLFDKIFPFEDKLTSEAVYYATMLAMAESFRFGIVSTSDMYYFCEDMVKAIAESKAKTNISRSLTCFPGDDPKVSKGYREAVALAEGYHNAEEGRIKIDMSVHAEYTNTEESIALVSDYAIKKGLNMHFHISETRTEHEECKQRHNGMTPTQLFNHYGAFDTRATAAHSIWIEEADMDIFAEKKVTVASCPVSNLKIASGICNVPELLRRGINVAIGTDSVASNNSLNYIEEMKFFALINKERRGDPTLITPRETIYAGTKAGAISQGRDDCGAIKVGNKADLIVIDLNVPNMRPVFDMANNIVYSASGSDVLLTMIDGKVVYNNGEYLTIDIEKTIYETEKNVKQIIEKLKTTE